MISSNTVLAFYYPKKPTVVFADASSYEFGGDLMQFRGTSSAEFLHYNAYRD